MDFDTVKAKKYLEQREALEKEQRERERIALLKHVIESIKKLLLNTGIEVYLVGSITQPYAFYPYSDIDLVIKNYKGDRFDLWTQLEKILQRRVEIIIFENCHFQDHVLSKGYKVL